ncbi:hypothetical protein BD408DRAFT_411561 [Parasitella parasitica]|nr:hypothetical protein BD408DRAFT_411561 [Parasitella parasitica]
MESKIMPESNHPFMTEDRLEIFNTCLQQTNSPLSTFYRTASIKTPLSTCSKINSGIVDDEDEQIKKKLIEAATNRLRQKRLEIKFQAMMAQIVELQCQLDIVKMDASISLQSLPTSVISETQLAHFEKRFAHHKMELQCILQRKEDAKPIKKTPASSPFLGASISSLLSLCSKSNKSDDMMEDESYYSVLGGSIHHHQKRRKRRHNQQKKHTVFMQNNEAAPAPAPAPAAQASTLRSEAISPYVSSDVIENSNESITASSSCSCEYSENNSISNKPFYRDTTDRHESLMLQSSNRPTMRSQEQDEQHRNTLDDVLSFLNDIAEKNVNDDDGFIQDMYDILDQQKLQQPPHTVRAAMATSIFHVLKYFSSRGLKWIKFAIVMALAIVINLKKGPNLF